MTDAISAVPERQTDASQDSSCRPRDNRSSDTANKAERVGSGKGVGDLPAHVLAAQLPLQAAWERVQEKAGMPGVDGVSVRRFAHTVPASLRLIERQLASGEYRPLPLRMAELEKKHGGRRLLLVPAVRDRIAQAAVATWLGTRWNQEFDAASFAYRPGLGVYAALRYLRELHEAGFRWVFDADIRSCFDSIPHDRLFQRLTAWVGSEAPLVEWLRMWIIGSVWDGADVSRQTCGIPQGSPLSPLVANFFLDTFDRRLRAGGVKFIRYADDFLVLTRTPFDLEPARQLVEETLGDLGLQLNAEKTQTTTFDRWFRFLGAEIQGEKILLPFDKKKTPLSAVFVAPVMPHALLKAWRLGHLTSDRPFVWTPRATDPGKHPAKGTPDRLARLLTRLSGGASAPLARRPPRG